MRTHYEQMIVLRAQAQASIEGIGETLGAGTVEGFQSITEVLNTISSQGGSQVVLSLRSLILRQALSYLNGDGLPGDHRQVSPEQLTELMKMTPFLGHEGRLVEHIGTSSALDYAILANLQWCMVESSGMPLIHQHTKAFFNTSSPELGITILDSSLRIPAINQSLHAARDIMNILGDIPMPWPPTMHTIMQQHMPVMEAFVQVEDHWEETLTVIPALCEQGYEVLAETLFNNIKLSYQTVTPELLDIVYQYFGVKGLSSKIPEIFQLQRTKTHFSTDEIKCLLMMTDRYGELEFPKAHWEHLCQPNSVYAFSPGVSRYLQEVAAKATPADGLVHPEAVNTILVALLDNSEERGAKQKMYAMISKDVPKHILLDLECFQDEVLAIDLGL